MAGKRIKTEKRALRLSLVDKEKIVCYTEYKIVENTKKERVGSILSPRELLIGEKE